MKEKLLIIKTFLSKKIVLISLFLVTALFAGIMVWTFATPYKFIVGGGSTSVQPALESLINEYESSINKKSDILYNSIGSSAALTGLNNKSYDFGFLSDPVSDDQALQLWNSKRLIRFVLARDYILLVYHLPTGIELKTTGPHIHSNPEDSKPALMLGNFTAKSSKGAIYIQDGVKNVQALYGNKSWNDVFRGSFENEEPVLNKPIATRITRENGSGTRSFFENSIIKEKVYNFNQIVTSNGEMLSTILNSPNSIGYLSFDYLPTLLDSNAFKNNQVGIFAVKVDGNKPCFPFKRSTGQVAKIVKYDFNSQYPLSRPFTGLMTTTNKTFLSVLKFVAWMLNPFNIPYGKKGVQYQKTYGSYWLLKNGVQPISFDNVYFKKYNYPFIDGNKRFKDIPSIFDLIKKYHFYNQAYKWPAPYNKEYK